ncbi:MAG: hypothetical protein WHT06_11295 [Desulfobacterales bacterium]
MKRPLVFFAALLLLLLALPWVGHAGHRTRTYVHLGFWFGPAAVWAPPPVWVAPPPVWVAPPPRFYASPPTGYVERGRSDEDYWFYCENPRGFYPYVRSCPGGWMRVVPDTVPPGW